MELAGELFSPTLRWWAGAVYALALYYALRMAPWRRLRDTEQLHVFLGACVSLILLWSMRIQALPGLQFHMLGVTSLTLMFGWSLALLGASLALLAVTLNGAAGWDGLVLSAFTLALLPITLTQVLLVVVRSLLPKNFFIYVLGNAFFTGGLAGLLSGYAAVGLLLWSGSQNLAGLSETLLPFFPLMFLPEGLLNGWIITVLAALRPHWLSSFDDDLYIRGK
jgi:uncharacterized membrane protein